jgi:predicted dehydrogenase
MNSPAHIGVIGCGKISDAYFRGIKPFESTAKIISCADIDLDRAREKAREHDIPKAYSVDELLQDPEVDLVLNLTIPQAHVPINLRALENGKHPYCEKPFALTKEEARSVLDAANKAGLKTGCAPDTFLGGGLQTCRKLIEDGAIGTPVAAVAFMGCPGHESWHPNPEFYYKAGGGPLFDMGPYYLTALVALIGPVARVSASARKTFDERIITSQPLNGTKIKVDVPTHYSGTLDFSTGAIGTMVMSFDIPGHHIPCIEIYGTEGSLSVPDPNTFKGPVSMMKKGAKEWTPVTLTHSEEVGRGIGIAEFARALQQNRNPRASGELAAHVVEVMQAFEESSVSGTHQKIESTVEKPSILPLDGSLDG